MKKPLSAIIKTVVILVAIVGFAYYGNLKYQAHLGQKAIESTGLNVLALDEALARLAKSGKPVLANLSAIWCPSCRRLDYEVLSKEAVVQKIENDYHYARVEFDSEEGKAFMKRYEVRGFPNLIILDGDGNSLKRLPRSFSPESFLQAL
ncbi:MAG TPA: hypothetical protein DIV79_16025 [Opitutae bacterium]|nr:hypothetical protein [Opitutaceae bacterium]HCR31513.1 hypothetical protein [Opitutae bacterium]|tara:strand:- start:167 stop:613 length:447 start_codon:yes stop_codon:yes gene_type:complete